MHSTARPSSAATKRPPPPSTPTRSSPPDPPRRVSFRKRNDHLHALRGAFMIGRRQLMLGGLAAGLMPAAAWAGKGSPLDATIDAFVAENKFHGVIVMARDGRITLARTFGYADVAA